MYAQVQFFELESVVAYRLQHVKACFIQDYEKAHLTFKNTNNSLNLKPMSFSPQVILRLLYKILTLVMLTSGFHVALRRENR